MARKPYLPPRPPHGSDASPQRPPALPEPLRIAPPPVEPAHEAAPTLSFGGPGSWQYLSLFMHGNFREDLNRLGRERWEVISMTPDRQFVDAPGIADWCKGFLVILKRPWPV